MKENLIHTAYMACAFLCLFASAEFIYHRFKVRAEITRKYVHVVTGLFTMVFPVFIQSHWLVLVLSVSFLVILVISLKINQLPSINNVSRVSRGSILYPIIVYLCYFIYQNQNHLIFFYVPILILAFCDPVAALVGKKWPKGRFTTFGQTKTLSGSFAFFVLGLVMSFGLISFLESYSTIYGLFIAFSCSLVGCLAEAFSHKGYDNFTVPTSVVLVLYVILNFI